MAEDLQILQHFRQHRTRQAESAMARILARRLDHHSDESVRDRIKRVISRLRQADVRRLQDECRDRPDHYAHFTRIDGRGRRTITHFAARPPTVAGLGLTTDDRRTVMRGIHQERRQMAKAYRLAATGRRHIEEETHTTADLFRIRDGIEHQARVASQTYCSRLRKRRPDLSCASKSKSRRPSDDSCLDDRDRADSPAGHRRQTDAGLKAKLDRFLHGLQSAADVDVAANSQVLADIVDHLAGRHGMHPQAVAAMIQDGQDLNVEHLRRRLLQADLQD